MEPKYYFFAVLLIVSGLLLIPASIVAVVDPFYILHKPYFLKDRGFEGPDRYLNAGLVNSWLSNDEENIDEILVGTSMSQQFPISLIKNEYGVSPMKLTAAGGTAKEISWMIQKALRTGNVKHVIWEVYSSYMHDDTKYLHAVSPLPTYLYTDKVIDRWKYLFNIDAVRRAVKVLLGREGKYSDLNDLYIVDHKEKYKRFHSQKNLMSLRANLAGKYKPLEESHLELEMVYPSIDENILTIVEQYPEVRFSFYFPPISYYNYAVGGDRKFWKRMLMMKYLLRNTQDRENVEVHSFDLLPSLGENLDNYIDVSHYSSEVCEKVLLKIYGRENVMNLDMFDAYMKSLIPRVNQFSREFMK